MTAAGSQLSPLIGDPDVAYLRSLSVAPQTSGATRPVLASTEKELEKALTQSGQAYSAIFINPRLAAPSGLPALRAARTLKPNTPIFFIHDEPKLPFQESELRGLTVNRTFRKPLSYS